MNVAAIFSMLQKGVGVIQTLSQVGQDVAPAIKIVTGLLTSARNNTVTHDELRATEMTLDQMIEDFNKPME